jgi:mannosyltransferase OCH1-like enzyme
VAIPRLIHQIWLGPNPPAEHEAAYRASWQRLHPDWQVRLWREGDLPLDCRRPEVYERLRHPAERSDILRLELLWRYGGVYVDTDFEARQPLDPLLEGVELFVGDMKPGRTNNAIIGAVRGHPLVDRALSGLRPVEWFGADPKPGTGPHYLDALLRPVRATITVFPQPVFYPANDGERATAHAIHHTSRSWVDVEGLRYRIAKMERRVEEAEADAQRSLRDLELLRTGAPHQRAGVLLRRTLARRR